MNERNKAAVAPSQGSIPVSSLVPDLPTLGGVPSIDGLFYVRGLEDVFVSAEPQPAFVAPLMGDNHPINGVLEEIRAELYAYGAEVHAKILPHLIRIRSYL